MSPISSLLHPNPADGDETDDERAGTGSRKGNVTPPTGSGCGTAREDLIIRAQLQEQLWRRETKASSNEDSRTGKRVRQKGTALIDLPDRPAAQHQLLLKNRRRAREEKGSSDSHVRRQNEESTRTEGLPNAPRAMPNSDQAPNYCSLLEIDDRE
ncbi:hypothetical protein NA57DRAFT_81863 [Rhizodiscina lignyota]|uniref:Uncharacterized protein n=1 Tax=Rhizodiscina lignyota TaxID=1504668 RepID=A0A9P4I5Q5_9PEZI|nr:hypothetical protein NA57DRAFT_81863 [Rhizodiscina lignyota]